MSIQSMMTPNDRPFTKNPVVPPAVSRHGPNAHVGHTETAYSLSYAYDKLANRPTTVIDGGNRERTCHQHAGGWGYETGHLELQGANEHLPPITLQHVGDRWYQPGIGRFIQRDPAALIGGLSAYGYARNRPVNAVDALGLWTLWDPNDPWVEGGPWWARWFLNATGATHNSILDDPATTNSLVVKSLAVPLGLAVLCIPGAAPYAYTAAGAWGLFRLSNGSTGSPLIDDIIDGAAAGTSIPSMTGTRLPKLAPSRGTLGGFPGSPNSPHILP